VVRWLATRRWSVTVAGAVGIVVALALAATAPLASVAIAVVVVATCVGVEVAHWIYLGRMRDAPIVPEADNRSPAASGRAGPLRPVEPRTARRSHLPAGRHRP